MKKGLFHRLKELTDASFMKCFTKCVKVKGMSQSPNVLSMNCRVSQFKAFVWWVGKSCSLRPLKESFINIRKLKWM